MTTQLTPLRIVIADDQPQMRQMLAATLRATPGVVVVGEARDGAAAVALAASLTPDVVLMDLVMPGTDGVEATRQIRAAGYPVRVLVLTSNGDRESVSRAMAAGADGYVLKGATAAEIRAAVKNVVRGGTVLAPAIARGVVDDYLGLIEERRRRDLAVIRTLAGAVERRDAVTGDHIHNVATLSVALWQHMTGSDPDEEMIYGFLLHDVGKIEIPDAILKKPGRLDDEETAAMRRHVQVGVDLIEPLGFGPSVIDVIRYHHERWDGLGYPNGLAGSEIPLHVRMFSIIDAYDAMTADRPYRKGLPPEQAIEEVERFSGSQFDPACVAAFSDMVAARLAAMGSPTRI